MMSPQTTDRQTELVNMVQDFTVEEPDIFSPELEESRTEQDSFTHLPDASVQSDSEGHHQTAQCSVTLRSI